MQSIEQQLQKLDQQRSQLLQRQRELRANRTFVCLCGSRHKFKACEGIRFWQRSYNSHEDGGWGEVHIICPRNGEINRMYFPPAHDVPYEERYAFDNDLSAQFQCMYMPLLKSIADGKADIHHYKWRNNTWVVNNYKKYELRVAYYEEMKAKLKGK